MLLVNLADGWIGYLRYVCFGLLMLALLVGSGFSFLFGAVLAWRAAVLKRSGIKTQGRVVEKVHSTRELEIPDTFVEFTDLYGNALRHKLFVPSSDDPPVGQLMDLIYNPCDPKEVSGTSYGQLWAIPFIACLCGAGGVLSVLWVVGRETGILPHN